MSRPNARIIPLYECHKKVRAARIKSITPGSDGTGRIVPHDEGVHAFTVSKAYMDKHQPKAGGYWVLYDDGYESWSPRNAFEDGYTRIE